MKKIQHKESGFTIPELIITIIFLGMVAIVISMLFITIGNVQGRTARLESATHAAQTKIESLRNNNYTQLTDPTINFTDELPDDLPNATGTVTISEPTPGLKRADVVVSYRDNNVQREVRMSSLIGVIGISQ